MIISNSRKFVFVHVMKTAGTSICAALDPSLRWNDVVLGGTAFGERVNAAYAERFGLRKHATAMEIRAVVGPEVWSEYFTFAFVRHPYTRTASFYRWLAEAIRRNPDPAAPVWSWSSTKAFTESRTFSEFIRHETFLATAAAQPQVASVCDDEGRCIVDFLGRSEDLDAGLRTVTQRLGLPYRPPGHHNASGGGRPAAAGGLFASADYDHLERLFRQDFDAFGYDPSLRVRPPA